ncbi:MAG: hypothetical protein K2L13_00170 [Opitutales bacterium]|nr:hypothetical protein [Opitutales bacterium]
MPVDYSGAIHSETFGINELSDAEISVRGEYRGQDVVLHPKTKSPIEQASEMEEYVIIRRQEKPKLRAREIRDKKRVAAQRQLLYQYISRLDRREGRRQRSNQQYQDCEAKLKRLRQRIKARFTEGSADELSIDGRDLAEIILEEVADIFSDVTEQDNFLQYFLERINIESAEAESEIRQAGKMLKRLEDRTDGKSVNRRTELQQRVEDLKDEITFLARFSEKLKEAVGILHNIHGQEIEDGYNLIPKATDLFASFVDGKFSADGDSARDIANLYQKALCINNLSELMRLSFLSLGAKNWKTGLKMLLELCAADIKSINPSRAVGFLIAVRDLIYRLITARDLYGWIKKLNKRILKFGEIGDNFEEKNGDENKSKRLGHNVPEKSVKKVPVDAKGGNNEVIEDEQFELTVKVAKLADQSFASSSQLNEILEALCKDIKDGLDILGEDRELAIFATTQLMELIRQLPMKFFTEIENREHVLEAMQAQLDELIVLEEQEENEEFDDIVVENGEDFSRYR